MKWTQYPPPPPPTQYYLGYKEIWTVTIFPLKAPRTAPKISEPPFRGLFAGFHLPQRSPLNDTKNTAQIVTPYILFYNTSETVLFAQIS